MSLHIECSTAPRDHFGKLLSSLEAADGLVWSETLAAGQVSEPLPPGAGLILTLIPTVDVWVAISVDPDPIKAPRRWLRAGIARTFEASGGLRIAWIEAAAEAPHPARQKGRNAAAGPAS